MFQKSKFLVSALSLFALTNTAFAELLIAPTRVVLEGNERSTDIVLVNKGTEPSAYRISMENRRMVQNGSMEEVIEAEDGELFAVDHVRFSPRRVLLGAEERQTVRISASVSGLEHGEYRSHLRFMGVPTSAGRSLSDVSGESEDGISIELIAIRSVTIPVILRVGDLSAEVELESATVAPGVENDEVLFVARLKRSGDKSTYGDIHIYAKGLEEPVYFARGIAIYTPNTERDVYMRMPKELATSLKGQELRIVYTNNSASNPAVLAELTTVVN